MKVLDKLNNIKLFGEKELSIEEAVAFFYMYRIYIDDLYNEDVSLRIKKNANYFLKSEHYGLDERENWHKFLSMKFN